jgi:hypothetical protein
MLSLVDAPFSERLMDGKAFEDFVAVELYRVGWPMVIFKSRAYQWKLGENLASVEIKHDRLWPKWGRLFIETKERRNSDGLSEWRDAGIYDASDPWLYVIGNEASFWIFSTKLLKFLHKSGRYEQKITDTSEGFVIPLNDADKYSIRRLNFS